jgi:hypothetical protein
VRCRGQAAAYSPVIGWTTRDDLKAEFGHDTTVDHAKSSLRTERLTELTAATIDYTRRMK